MKTRNFALQISIFLAAANLSIASQAASPATPQEVRLNLGTLGSEKTPLSVRTIPPEKSIEDLDKDSYEVGEKGDLDRDAVKFNRWTAFATIAMLFVAVVQALFFSWQLKLMRTAMRDSEAASNAAILGANAARDNADVAREAMIAGQRAYIQYHQIQFISHPDIGTGNIFWRMHPQWINVGRTPDRGLKLFVKYELSDTPVPEDFPFEINSEEMISAALPAGSIITRNTRDFLGTDLLAVKEGKKYLYIWGKAKYNSVFKGDIEHVTWFCVRAAIITGDPLKKFTADAPFDIKFSHHGRLNYMDEPVIG